MIVEHDRLRRAGGGLRPHLRRSEDTVMAEQSIRIGQTAVRQGVLSVLDQRFLEKVNRFPESFFGPLVEVIPALQVQVVRSQILCRPPRAGRRSAIADLRFQLLDDALRNLFLRLDPIVQAHIDDLGPHIAAARAVDELRADADPVSRLPYAAIDDERTAGFSGVRRENPQVRKTREMIDDLVPQAFAEVVEILRCAQVGERYDHDSIAPGERCGN